MDGFKDDGSGDDFAEEVGGFGDAEEVGGFGDAVEEVDHDQDIKPTSTVPPEKGEEAPVAGLAERLFCRLGGDAVLDEEDDNEDADKVRLNDGSSVRLAALKEIRAHPREKSEGRARRDYLEDILTLLKEDPTDVSWYANADADAEKMPDLLVATKRAAERVQTEACSVMAEILDEDLEGGERGAYLPRLVHLFEKPLADIRGTAYNAFLKLPEEEQKPFVADWVKLIGNDKVSLDARKEACTKYGQLKGTKDPKDIQFLVEKVILNLAPSQLRIAAIGVFSKLSVKERSTWLERVVALMNVKRGERITPQSSVSHRRAVRVRAIKLFGELTENERKSIGFKDFILSIKDKKEKTVRGAACDVVPKLSAVERSGTLIAYAALLNDSDSAVCQAAIENFGQLTEAERKPFVGTLVGLLKSTKRYEPTEETEIRCKACEAVGNLTPSERKDSSALRIMLGLFKSKRPGLFLTRVAARTAFLKFSVAERADLVDSFITMVGGNENRDLEESEEHKVALQCLLQITYEERHVDDSRKTRFVDTFSKVYEDAEQEEQREICIEYGDYCSKVDRKVIDPALIAILDKAPPSFFQTKYPALVNAPVAQASLISMKSYDSFGSNAKQDKAFLKKLSAIATLSAKECEGAWSKFVEFYVADPEALKPHVGAAMQVFQRKATADVDIDVRLTATRDLKHVWTKVEADEQACLEPLFRSHLQQLFTDKIAKIRTAAYEFLWECLPGTVQEPYLKVINDNCIGGLGQPESSRKRRGSISSVGGGGGGGSSSGGGGGKYIANPPVLIRKDVWKQAFANLEGELRAELLTRFISDVLKDDSDVDVQEQACITFFHLSDVVGNDGKYAGVHELLGPPESMPLVVFFNNQSTAIRKIAYKVFANLTNEERGPYLVSEGGYFEQCVEDRDDDAIISDALAAFFKLDVEERIPSMKRFLKLYTKAPRTAVLARQRCKMFCNFFPRMSVAEREKHVPKLATVVNNPDEAKAIKAAAWKAVFQLEKKERDSLRRGRNKLISPFDAKSKEMSVEIMMAVCEGFGLLSIEERRPNLDRFYRFLSGKEDTIQQRVKKSMTLSKKEKLKIQRAACASFSKLTFEERGEIRLRDFIQKMGKIDKTTRPVMLEPNVALESLVDLFPLLVPAEYAFLAKGDEGSDLLSKHFFSILERNKANTKFLYNADARKEMVRGYFRLPEAQRNNESWIPKMLNDTDDAVLTCVLEGIAGLPFSERAPLLVDPNIATILKLLSRPSVREFVKTSIKRIIISDLKVPFHFLENTSMPGVSIDLSACCKELQKSTDACEAVMDPVTEYIVKMSEDDVTRAGEVAHAVLRAACDEARGGGRDGGDGVVSWNIASQLKAAKSFLERYVAPFISGCSPILVHWDDRLALLQKLTKMFLTPVEKLIREIREEYIAKMSEDEASSYVQKKGKYDKMQYTICFNKIKDRDQDNYDEMLSTFTLLKEDVDTTKTPRQQHTDLIALTSAVRSQIHLFRAFMDKLKVVSMDVLILHRGSISGFTLVGQDTKGLYRMMEKTLLKPRRKDAPADGEDDGDGGGGIVDYSLLLDVGGCMITCSSFKDMTGVLTSMVKMHHDTHTPFTIVRFKHRWIGATATGWRDFMVNVAIHDVIFEVQLVHSDMLIVREELGGHDGYEEIRAIVELFKYQNKKITIDTDDALLQQEIELLKKRLERSEKQVEVLGTELVARGMGEGEVKTLKQSVN